jgi:PAS domain S-box-containing protein
MASGKAKGKGKSQESGNSVLEKAKPTTEDLHSLIDDMPALICRFLPDGTLTLVNEEYASYFNQKKDDLVGNNFFQFIPKEAQERVKRQFLSLDEKIPAVTYEHQVIAPNGELRWQRWTDKAILDDRGRVREYQSIGVDITDRKRAEEKLAESEERYRRIVESSLAGILLIQDGRFLFVNSRVREIYGGQEEDLIGKYFWEFIHPDDREMVKLRGQGRERGEPQLDHYEFRGLRKDGSSIWLEVRATVTEFTGKPAILGNVIDITDRKQAERELREREAKYRLLAENTTDVIFIQDMNLRLTYLSPSVTSLFGYTVEEALDLKMEQFLTEDSLKRAKESFSQYVRLASEDPDIRIPLMQYEYIRKDGTTFWGELKANFLRDHAGRLVGSQGVLRDISERRRAEEELKAKAIQLEEMNTALKVLLDHREEETKQMGENILSNSRKLIFPYLEKMQAAQSNGEKETYLGIIRSNLEQLTSPFMGASEEKYQALTPTELQVADLIRHGMGTKEIASMLNISPEGVSFHRTNIRKKLNLQGRKVNLRTYLQNL